MGQVKRKLGLGTISLLLCTIGVLFAFSFGEKGALGDYVLRFMGLKAWSHVNGGVHYTIFYTMLFFVPSVIFGFKFKYSLGAKLGRVISSFLIIVVFLAIIFSVATSMGSSQLSYIVN